jgi:CheY-like chemotaxis protein
MSATATVLVVDDDFDVRESIVDLLLEDGFDALSAKDGREGLYELRVRPDVGLIVLDLSMPMMDGKAFRQEQLSDPELASIPVIVLSGDENCENAAASLGARASLKKPFSPEALLGAIRSTASSAAA